MSEGRFDIKRLRAGDETTWHAAFRALWPIALHAALNPAAALSIEDAQEVAGDALARLVPLVDKVGSESDLKALLAAMAYRGAISRARHNSAAKRGARITGSLQQPQGTSTLELPAPAVTDHFTDDELARLTELLRRALAFVDEPTRKLLLDNVVREMTCHELSAKYRIPTGTVSSKLSRGLKRIRTCLASSPKLWQQLRDYLR